MAKKAEIEVGLGGIQGGIKDLGDLRNALLGVEGAGKKLDASYRGLKKLWEDPSGAKGGWSSGARALMDLNKMAIGAIADQATAQASAITGPAKSTWDSVLANGRRFREDYRRVATATGQSTELIGQRIMSTSKSLGLLPGQVMGYGRAVRSMTGDWEGAIGGMDAFQNRALKTDRTIEQLIPTAITLAETFGVKSTAEVNKFFGTLDAGARGAGISAQIAEHAFMSASGMMSRITGAGPQAIAALTSQIVGNAKARGLSTEVGLENVSEVGGILSSKERFLERTAIKRGLIPKGGHLTEGGRYTPQGGQIALEVLQSELPKFYRTKNREELIGRMAESGLISPLGAAAVLDFRPQQFKADSARRNPADDMSALRDYLSSGAGRGSIAAATKEANDIQYGMTATTPAGKDTMLDAQDAAKLGGGGRAGLAMTAAPPLLSGAAMMLREGNGRAEEYEKELQRRRSGTAMPANATWMQKNAGLRLWSDKRLEDSARAARGFSDVESYRGYMDASGKSNPPQMAGSQPPPGSIQPSSGGQAVTIDRATPAQLEEALKKALGSVTVKTQAVQPPRAPEGMSIAR